MNNFDHYDIAGWLPDLTSKLSQFKERDRLIKPGSIPPGTRRIGVSQEVYDKLMADPTIMWADKDVPWAGLAGVNHVMICVEDEVPA